MSKSKQWTALALAGGVAVGAAAAWTGPAREALSPTMATAQVSAADATSARANPTFVSATLRPSEGADALPADHRALVDELRRTSGGELQAAVVSGPQRFIKAAPGRLLVEERSGAAPEARARAFLSRYGALVGLGASDGASGAELELVRVDYDPLGGTHVRFGQKYRGLPVLGTQLVVHLTEDGVSGVNGALLGKLALEVEPTLTDTQAIAAARREHPAAGSEAHGVKLAVYPRGLLEGAAEVNGVLAWAAELESDAAHEEVWVDAANGEVLNRIPLRHSAKYRIVYSPEYLPDNPDLFVQRREGDPPSLIPQVNNLYDYAGQTYNFFASGFGRDSYDGLGHIMRSVYLVNQNCPNAYWNGVATNYCPGFDLDDVVAHEWGHAYTEYTHGLIYSYQSGALNESYSDIYGEGVDLLNENDGLLGGANNAEPYPAGQRWLVGEDLGQVVHELLLRDMWDPERLGYPAKVSSANYVCGTSDGGGVHSNSGVPNHAFAMLVDGKTFNGQTVEGIGLDKATNIYWRAASVYQTPVSNFAAHADALEASCQDLIGQPLTRLSTTSETGAPLGETISQFDCDQVAKAIAATELRVPPTQCGFVPQLDPNTPAQCSGAVTLFREDFESGSDGWTLESVGSTVDWPDFNWTVRSELPDARAGSSAFAIDSRGGTCVPGGDHSGRYAISSPVFTVPAGATSLQARFTHYVETELGYDGGNVKISVNGGAFTLVPLSAYLFNAPTRTLEEPAPLGQNTNPKAGENAWHGADGGEVTGSWGTTILALSSLVQPGDTFQLQFDFGIDGCNGVTGWFVDDVETYDCSGAVTLAPAASFRVTPSSAQARDELTFDASESRDGDTTGSGVVSYSWTFGDGATVTTFEPVTTHTYTEAGTYEVSLQVTDDDGETGTATQSVVVNPAPTPKPDLVVQSIQTVTTHKGVDVVATIANVGDADAPGSRTEVLVDGRLLGEVDTAPVPAGGTATASAFWDLRGVKGSHLLEASSDQSGSADEHDETNNTGRRTVNVQGGRVK